MFFFGAGCAICCAFCCAICCALDCVFFFLALVVLFFVLCSCAFCCANPREKTREKAREKAQLVGVCFGQKIGKSNFESYRLFCERGPRAKAGAEQNIYIFLLCAAAAQSFTNCSAAQIRRRCAFPTPYANALQLSKSKLERKKNVNWEGVWGWQPQCKVVVLLLAF